MLMRVAVRPCVATGYFLRRCDAAVEGLAADMLELNRGVADLVMVAEQVIELCENAGARRRRNVRDGDVTGKSA